MRNKNKVVSGRSRQQIANKQCAELLHILIEMTKEGPSPTRSSILTKTPPVVWEANTIGNLRSDL